MLVIATILSLVSGAIVFENISKTNTAAPTKVTTNGDVASNAAVEPQAGTDSAEFDATSATAGKASTQMTFISLNVTADQQPDTEVPDMTTIGDAASTATVHQKADTDAGEYDVTKTIAGKTINQMTAIGEVETEAAESDATTTRMTEAAATTKMIAEYIGKEASDVTDREADTDVGESDAIIVGKRKTGGGVYGLWYHSYCSWSSGNRWMYICSRCSEYTEWGILVIIITLSQTR